MKSLWPPPASGPPGWDAWPPPPPELPPEIFTLVVPGGGEEGEGAWFVVSGEAGFGAQQFGPVPGA